MIHYTISKPSQNYPSTHTGVLVESSSQSLSRSVGLLDAQMPKFHLLHHDTTCSVCRVASWRAVMRVAPCLLQHGRLWKSSSAHVYKFSILCSGFASISGRTSGKSEVDMSTPVHAVRMPLNTCHAVTPVAFVVTSVSCRAVWQVRHSTSRLFPVSKCMG